MKIDQRLNLVVRATTAGGDPAFVHSTPISRDVFETYFLVIGRAFSSIMARGMSVISGPRVAALMLKKIAIEDKAWDGPGGVENGLFAEIRRLTNVVAPSQDKTGWTTIPYQVALSQGLIDEDEAAEVEGQIVFFILASSISKKSDIPSIAEAMTDLWGTQVTSSAPTAFAGSLPTPTEVANTGGTVAAS